MLTLTGSVAMGTATDAKLAPGECIYVPTGGEIPAGADAVVMVEYTELAAETVLVRRPVAPGENMVARGEDFSHGQIVLGQGRRLSPQDIGALAAVGCAGVPVTIPPKIGIISTGNELVQVTTIPEKGQVRDVNSYLCGAFAESRGCRAVHYGITRDTRDALGAVLARAVKECDAVLISGGSSKDERDMTARIIGDTGEVLAHGIAIAPGKPTIIGRSGSIPVIGLPGHPASAFVVLVVIVRHLLEAISGEETVPVATARAVLTQNIPSARGREDYVRVALEMGKATPIFGKSGLLNTLVRSHGVVMVPAGSEGFERGEVVEVLLW
jgi:molybdopterin molybdotransferase